MKKLETEAEPGKTQNTAKETGNRTLEQKEQWSDGVGQVTRTDGGEMGSSEAKM